MPNSFKRTAFSTYVKSRLVSPSPLTVISPPSKKALQKIAQEGVTQRQVGLKFDGAPIPGSNDEFWAITARGVQIGYVTSAVYSPRLKQNIALAMVSLSASEIGTLCQIETSEGRREAKIVPKPFYDPKKTLAAQS